jgi:hypothetical protein
MQMTLQSVDNVFALFAASDELLRLFEERDVPIKVAVELARYERATNEARARQLAARYRETPLTCQEIVALRKRQENAKKVEQRTRPREAASREGLRRSLDLFAREFHRDADTTLAELGAWLEGVGYALVPARRAETTP